MLQSHQDWPIKTKFTLSLFLSLCTGSWAHQNKLRWVLAKPRPKGKFAYLDATFLFRMCNGKNMKFFVYKGTLLKMIYFCLGG